MSLARLRRDQGKVQQARVAEDAQQRTSHALRFDEPDVARDDLARLRSRFYSGLRHLYSKCLGNNNRFISASAV